LKFQFNKLKPARVDVAFSLDILPAKYVLEIQWAFVLVYAEAFPFMFFTSNILYIFYNNCLISWELIGSFLLSIKVQTDKILIYNCASREGQLSAVELSTF